MKHGPHFVNGSGVNYGYDGDGEMQIGQVDGGDEEMPIELVDADADSFETQEQQLVAENESVSVRDTTNQIDEVAMRTGRFGFETQELVVDKELVNVYDGHLGSCVMEGVHSKFDQECMPDSSPP